MVIVGRVGIEEAGTRRRGVRAKVASAADDAELARNRLVLGVRAVQMA